MNVLRLGFVFTVYLLSVLICGSVPAVGDQADASLRLDYLAQVVSGMSPGEWRPLRGSIQSVFPSRAELGSFWGTGGPRALPAWSGAAVGGGAFWLWGGGHADYGGNEIYRYDLATGEWHRFGPWLKHDVGAGGCLNPKNAPVSAHTANGVWWAHDRLWVAGYSGYCRGGGTQQGVRHTWSFYPKTESWTAYPAIIGTEPHIAYDVGRDLVYQWSRRHRLDIYGGNSLELLEHSRGPLDYVPDYAHLVFDTERGLVYGQAKDRLYLWPVGPDGLWTGAQEVIDGMPSATGGLALRNGRLYFWQGGSTVRRFDPITHNWKVFEGQGGPRPFYDRMFSKWQFVPAVDAFLGFSRPDHLFVWRPPDAHRRTGSQAMSAQPDLDTGSTRVAPVAASSQKWHHDPHTFGGLPRYDARAARPGRPRPDDPTAGLVASMRTTGDRPEIGLVTAWQAALLAGDTSYRDVVLAQASAEVAGRLKWSPEHNYPLYWVPYLLTGDEQYLERMRAQWQRYQVDHRRRRFEGPLDALSEREFAWQLRNLAQLAKADPRYTPVLERTRQFVLEHYVNGGRPGRKVLHNIGRERRDVWTDPQHLGTAFWQQAFVGQVLAHVVLLGHESWRPILEHNFAFWRRFVAEKPKHIDGPDLFYWSAAGGDLHTWEAIIANHESAGWLRTQPDRLLFTGRGVGVRHIRAQQALHAIGLAALAGVDGAEAVFSDYRGLVEARARSHRLPMTIRDAVVVP